jgi:hypothetical protein
VKSGCEIGIFVADHDRSSAIQNRIDTVDYEPEYVRNAVIDVSTATSNHGVPIHHGMPPSTPFQCDEEVCPVETSFRLPESSHTGP